jgi:hypothetical protein
MEKKIKTVFFNLSMAEALRDDLKIQAMREKKSMNELVNEMIFAYIKQYLSEKDKKTSSEIN